MLAFGVGATILPPALTYARTWKPTAAGVFAPQVAALARISAFDNGSLIAAEIMMPVIELLRRECVTQKLGVASQIEESLWGEIVIPRQ